MWARNDEFMGYLPAPTGPYQLLPGPTRDVRLLLDDEEEVHAEGLGLDPGAAGRGPQEADLLHELGRGAVNQKPLTEVFHKVAGGVGNIDVANDEAAAGGDGVVEAREQGDEAALAEVVEEARAVDEV